MSDNPNKIVRQEVFVSDSPVKTVNTKLFIIYNQDDNQRFYPNPRTMKNTIFHY